MPNARPLWPVGVNHHAETECCHPRCGAAPHPEATVPLCGDHLIKAAADAAAIWRPRYEDGALASPAPPPRDSWVYFIRFGDRIKIGFSTDYESRIAALPHDEVLAVVSGTHQDERRCHAAFKHLRLTGEWFQDTPELRSFISDIVAGQGGVISVPKRSYARTQAT